MPRNTTLPTQGLPVSDTTTPSCNDAGCGGFQTSRRSMLGGIALGGLTAVTGSTVVTMSSAPAFAADAVDAPVLVVLSLRGAADGLSMVVPHGDPVYYQARPQIAVPMAQLLATDSFFGLHPALAPLLPMWNNGELAAVHATGLPVANRSHFAAIEEVEDADPGSAARTGWLNRLLGEAPALSPLTGVSVTGGAPPASMFGENPAMSFLSLATATIAGDSRSDPARARLTSLQQVWAADQSGMGKAVRGAMAAVDGLDGARAQRTLGVQYPASDLGQALATVARTLRGGSGTQLVTVDSGSWDMHSDLGTPTRGRMLDNLTDLARSVAAFFDDLGTARDRVTLVTISEFGRRVVENSATGLDHGWGNAMLVAGANVAGSRYYGRWPGLENNVDSDLSVTTDYRSVLAEVVATRFPTASVPSVFPGFTREHVGVMSAS
ncbi:DUF1501 domain-containing protein [Nocardioides sp. AX2bis]|uniref:DUF1501 domain-containing protein n=1 Tax=Nocardioides sp. AX2bis TaxID=2653157 RepID=UPI0012F17182|nr:DUF1501 domain-containing protein [Nocardioides sp. AX2bis]VXC52056.1 conserved hypothetical protein [Nocardioides sp. AX2bis]